VIAARVQAAIPPTGAIVRLSEAHAEDTGADGFRRLTLSGGQRQSIRDLQPMRQDRMLRLVYYLWEGNPLAQLLIELTIDFILGEGARVDSDHADVREVIRAFWDDPVNQLDRRLDPFTREFRLYGELCLPAEVDATGRVRLAVVDPLDIDEVITDPLNILIQTGVKVRSATPDRKGRVLKIIRRDDDPRSPTFDKMIGHVEGDGYDGACFLWQTNKVSNARRGRSDLVALIDWLDGYDQFMFDSMDVAAQLNSFAYTLKLTGMGEAEIDAYMRKFTALQKRGGIFAHNEKAELGVVSPDLKAQDKDAYAALLAGHIAGSRGIPEHMLGRGSNTTQASAKEMGLVPVKRFSRAQKELRGIIADLVRFAIDQAVLAGTLAETVTITKAVRASGDTTADSKPANACFTVVLPELSMKDQAGTVAAVTTLTQALQQAELKAWIRPATAARLFALLVSQLGLEIRSEDEYDPAAAQPGMDAYDQQGMARILAQLRRQGEGNGENIGEPKRTTPVGGQVGT
jgi:hypothetical protein